MTSPRAFGIPLAQELKEPRALRQCAFFEISPELEKKKLFVLSGLACKTTSEKVVEGFRYFACGVDAVMDGFQRGDFAALKKLRFSLDEDGDPDASCAPRRRVHRERRRPGS